jgi:hypothetical protein
VRVILGVLALIWVVALTPIALRKLREREGSYSVARFQGGLRAMRRAFPRDVATAGAGGMGLLGGQSMARRVGMPPASRPALPVTPAEGTRARSAGPVRTAGPSARRRRQVLAYLGCGLVLSFLFGIVPALRLLWDVSLLLLALTAAYLALLIHFRRLADERAEKVVFLEQPAGAPITAPLPKIQPYYAGRAPAPAFRPVAGVHAASASQGVRPQPVVVGG